MDAEKAEILRKFGRLDGVQCGITLAVDVEGEVVALFHIDNFKDERTFDADTLELARFFAYYFGILFLRSKLEWTIEEQRKMMEYLARHDPLTNLVDQRLFQEHGEKVLALARRQKEEVIVVFLDLIKFKQINDTFGDEVLKVVGSRLEELT